MSKFIMACPVCKNYVKADNGFFAKKHIRCTCGNIINVKTDRMTSCECPSCGNSVVYDQADGTDVKCPVCQAQLVTQDTYNNLVHFRCGTCGCQLHSNKAAVSVTCPVCDTVCDVQQEIKKAEVRDQGIPTVINYEGDNTTFVWKHPMTDFVTGSQLIVHESQEAVFFRNGEALDSFGPGRYTLETGILPKMNKLYPVPVDGQAFHAEVYFVNLTTQLGIKWGTPSKVGLFDPATGMHVELGASGSFNLRVTDARKLLIKVVGTTGGLKQSDVFSGTESGIGGGFFRTMIATRVKSNLARIIKENRISVLELDEHVDTISLKLREAIEPDMAEYGLAVPEFYVANIVTPDDDPNFRRMKQQHADLYLKTREEEIKKAEAEAAFERKSVEAQTAARMKVIGAQGDADAERIRAQAQADAYRMQAEAEAMEMKMKGYTYQQETQRQVTTEAVRNGGGMGGSGMLNGVTGMMGDVMQLGVGLGAVGSVMGMAKEAIQPAMQAAGSMMQPMMDNNSWNCSCGQGNITSKFCPECGSKRPEAPKPWDCTCGCKGITSKFCPECGNKKPEAWDCSCGKKGITGKFCPECGTKKQE